MTSAHAQHDLVKRYHDNLILSENVADVLDQGSVVVVPLNQVV